MHNRLGYQGYQGSGHADIKKKYFKFEIKFSGVLKININVFGELKTPSKKKLLRNLRYL